jgi:Kef-type K+ transport system membrane component KefB
MDTVQVLLSVGVVIIVVRLIGRLLTMAHQPRVMGEIVAGIVLGPSVLGLFWPGALGFLFPPDVVNAFRVLAQFGLVLFMFLVGLELNLASLRGEGRRATVISVASIIVPFGLGIGLAYYLYPTFGMSGNRTAFCLFIGAAVAITAFPVLARILQEAGMFHTRVGVLVITCAAINDVIAWCLLAVVVSVAGSTGVMGVLGTMALSLLYVVVMFTIVKPLLARAGVLPVWAVLVVVFVSAWTTEWIGIHAIFGAFLAGAVMPGDVDWRRDVHLRLEATVSNFVLPIFFVVVGLSTRVDGLGSWHLLGVLALVVLVATAGKFGGASIAARMSGERWPSALTIGVLMNTRGLTEIVILTVGLQLAVIDTRLFTIMVLMAIITTVVAAPLLRLLSRYDPVSEAVASEPGGIGGRTSDGAGGRTPAGRAEPLADKPMGLEPTH